MVKEIIKYLENNNGFVRPEPFIKADISISIRNNTYSKKILSILIFSIVKSGITINTAIKGLNGSPMKAKNPPIRNSNRYAVQKDMDSTLIFIFDSDIY